MKLRCLILTVFAMLVLAPAALAAGSAGSGYGGAGGNVQNDVQQGALNASETESSGGSLPFTGLDLSLLVVGGMTLLVVGAGLRRAARHKA
jgi:hypothetical protein